MRYIKNVERKKRGCEWCIDTVRKYTKIRTTGKTNIRMQCIHKKCPYHELDNVKSYTEYLRSIGTDSVSAILKALLRSEQSVVCE